MALHVTPAKAGDRAEVGRMAQAIQGEHGIALEVIKLPEAKRGFVLLPRRCLLSGLSNGLHASEG